VDVQNISAADFDSALSFGTATVVEETVPATAGVLGSALAAVSHANAGSPSPGDTLLIRVQRLGDSSSPADDASGNLQFDHIYVEET